MNKIKNTFLNASTRLFLTCTRVFTSLKNNNGSVVEAVGLIIVALVIIALFLAAMKTMTTTNLNSVASKMASLFN